MRYEHIFLHTTGNCQMTKKHQIFRRRLLERKLEWKYAVRKLRLSNKKKFLSPGAKLNGKFR